MQEFKSASTDRSFLVSHLSARREYDVARMLNDHALLDKLFTDGYYNTQEIPLFKLLDKVLPAKIVNTYRQYQPAIPATKISYDWLLALKFKIALAVNSEGNYKAKIKGNRRLSKHVIAYCKKGTKANSFYGFDGASLEFFNWANAGNGNWSLFLEQCGAPRSITIDMHKRFESELGLDERIKIKECLVMQERERQEWQLASKIIVPSKFVYDELLKDGADKNKVSLVNYGYDAKHPDSVIWQHAEKKFKQGNDKIIRILFCGNAGFRKGIHDLLKLAEMLKNERVEFRVAGNIENRCLSFVSKYNLPNVVFLGKLNFSALQDEYSQADMFILPSYIEGSAMVNFEAMSWALPVITTYESGCVFEDNVDGIVVRAGEVVRMKEQIQQLIANPLVRHEMGIKAMTKLKNYSIKQYNSNLLQEVQRTF